MPDIIELLDAYKKRYPKKAVFEKESKPVTTVTKTGK